MFVHLNTYCLILSAVLLLRSARWSAVSIALRRRDRSALAFLRRAICSSKNWINVTYIIINYLLDYGIYEVQGDYHLKKRIQ
jgi:hypothetical protein